MIQFGIYNKKRGCTIYGNKGDVICNIKNTSYVRMIKYIEANVHIFTSNTSVNSVIYNSYNDCIEVYHGDVIFYSIEDYGIDDTLTIKDLDRNISSVISI